MDSSLLSTSPSTLFFAYKLKEMKQVASGVWIFGATRRYHKIFKLHRNMIVIQLPQQQQQQRHRHRGNSSSRHQMRSTDGSNNSTTHNNRKTVDLAIINPVCLNEAGERRLERLGRVRHIFRLEAYHQDANQPQQQQAEDTGDAGRSNDLWLETDRYYTKRYPLATLWTPTAEESYSSPTTYPSMWTAASLEPSIRSTCSSIMSSSTTSSALSSSSSSSVSPLKSFLLCEGMDLPAPLNKMFQVFSFHSTRRPEVALLLHHHHLHHNTTNKHNNNNNILITSTVLQSQQDNPLLNMPARTAMQVAGFMESKLVVSPTWLRGQQHQPHRHAFPTSTTGHGSSLSSSLLRDEFERLLKLDFGKVIGASGILVEDDAKAEAVMAVELAFPQWSY